MLDKSMSKMLDKHLCAQFLYHCLWNTSKIITLPEKLQVFVSQCLIASTSRHQHPALLGFRIKFSSWALFTGLKLQWQRHVVGCVVETICWALRHSENEPTIHFYNLILDVSSDIHTPLLYKLYTSVTSTATIPTCGLCYSQCWHRSWCLKHQTRTRPNIQAQ